MTGGGEKAALALIGAVGDFACTLRRLARSNELGLDALAVGDVADGRGDEHVITILNRTQADLDGKLRSILPPAEELQARSHRAYANVAGVLLSMADVSSPKSLRHELLDAEPDDLVVGIAEERGYLTVRESDRPGAHR